MAVLELFNERDGKILYHFWCPGCKEHHGVWVKSNPNPVTGATWDFNGNMEKPTFSPSILLTWGPGMPDKRCHLFIRDGQLQYCGDSSHEFAGKTVDMVDLEHLS